MIQSQDVTQLMEKDTLNVADAFALWNRTANCPDKNRTLRLVKENIGLLKGASLCKVIGHGQNAVPNASPKTVEANEAELTPSPEETGFVESITAANWTLRIFAFQASIAGLTASFQVWLPS